MTDPIKQRLPTLLLWLVIGVFAVFFGALAVQQHWTFRTHGLDLGNVDQALWNTAQGRFLHFTLMAPVHSRLALHVEPILLAFVPFYWVGLGRPELLLVAQAVVVALGAYPVYRLAMSQYQLATENPAWIAPYILLIFPLAYLLLPTLESAMLFDFHAVTLAPTFILWAFLALEQHQPRRFIVLILLTMACKEDMPLLVAMLGVYLLTQKRWRLAAVTLSLSIIWFVMAFFVIQPTFAGGNIQLDRYAWLGDSPPEMLLTAVTQPQLVFDHVWHTADLPGYLFDLFFPVAFLALLSPLTLLPMLPNLVINLLSANPFTWRLEDFHYGVPFAPFLLISAIYGVGWLTRRMPRRQSAVYLTLTIVLLGFTVVYHSHRGYTPLSRAFEWPARTAHDDALHAVINAIPPEVPLFAQSNLTPQLSQREIIYGDFGYFTNPDFVILAPVEGILLDATRLENFGGIHQYLRQNLINNSDYHIVTAQDGIIYLESSATPADLPTTFYTFTIPDAPLEHPLTVDFGDAIRLHGYTLHFNRQEEVEISLTLEALRPLSDEVQPVLYLLDALGQPLGGTADMPATMVWLPASQWQVGERVQVRFNTLPWFTRTRESYRLALGMVSGTDIWAIPARLTPQIRTAGDIAPRLPADRTLVELARFTLHWDIPTGGPSRRQVMLPRMSVWLEADFNQQVMLEGYSLSRNADSTMSIKLVWQATESLPDLTRFVQVIGPDGTVFSQSDAAPDQYPLSLWQPGEIVSETVTLPITEGAILHVGLYDPLTGQRLPLVTGGDHVVILLE
ncbi:MAG: DUF2079 domain-containing protein [Okeania sp. SIO3B3]|nr:DUF2079 domain-containing protein [Okeania sp. SIO3B3]